MGMMICYRNIIKVFFCSEDIAKIFLLGLEAFKNQVAYGP